MLDVAARSAGAILSRTARIRLGEQEFDLPVLSIAGNRRWREKLEVGTAGLVDALTQEGADESAILAALSTRTDMLLDLLISYDVSGKLPSREEIEELATEWDLLAAVQEVWRAANPLVVTAVRAAMTGAATTNDSSEPTSSPPPRTGGSRKKSKPN